MSHVFHRSPNPMMAASAEGCWVYDSQGKAYLDAAGGAIVNSIGHGDPTVVAAMAAQAATVDYVHATAFTTDATESYAAKLAPYLPVVEPRIFPTSGGSEATETALKMARAYHLTRGEDQRTIVISREMSYHGNTVWALDVSGRLPLRRPYEPWLGRTAKVPRVTEYRCPAPDHPVDCATWHADRLEEAIAAAGAGRVAAFIAEPIGGATLGATAPPEGYWPAVAEVCRRHGVLLIADEVMTGFGRTGRWFGIDHYETRPDILIAAKGAASGYWPIGLAVASGVVHSAISESFIHGFTFSHFPVGSAVAGAVLDRLVDGELVEAADKKGESLIRDLRHRLEGSSQVGDIRGVGLLIAVELVADPVTKRPHPRSARVAERITAAAREAGLLVYPSIGCADGVDGDLILIGPPLTITEEEMAMLVDRLGTAIGAAT